MVNLDDQTRLGSGSRRSRSAQPVDHRHDLRCATADQPDVHVVRSAAHRRHSVTVQAAVNRVYANRGEVIDNLNGQLEINNGVVQRADLTGQFISGGPVTLKITSGTQGTREMRVVGRDAGAALRASNLYSKVAGGSLEFSAVLDAGAQSGIQRGLLVIRNFEVRNEVALSNINEQDRAKKPSGPRRDAASPSRG